MEYSNSNVNTIFIDYFKHCDKQMTAIAWAIVFTGSIFYVEIYGERLKIQGTYDTMSNFIIFELVVLIICTIRELFR